VSELGLFTARIFSRAALSNLIEQKTGSTTYLVITVMAADVRRACAILAADGLLDPDQHRILVTEHDKPYASDGQYQLTYALLEAMLAGSADEVELRTPQEGDA
jgi:hypothetical protein